mgnify:CR=1 FL=1
MKKLTPGRYCVQKFGQTNKKTAQPYLACTRPLNQIDQSKPNSTILVLPTF